MRHLVLLLGLSGCWYLDDARFQREVQDWDGDGGIAERFGGRDCVDDDPTVADCDADGDGFRTTAAGGDDCDDHDAGIVPGTPFFADLDADGFGAGEPIPGCGLPGPGLAASDADCDDGDRAIFPGAPETCAPADQDCDGDPFAGAADADVAVYADGDRDGYGTGSAFLVCEPRAGEATLDGDCADADAAIHPAAAEVGYDGVDQDCDPGNEFDLDGDGHPHRDHGGDDCDDAAATAFPGAPELCDTIDNDCDGLADDEEADGDQAPGEQLRWFLDNDGDGYGGAVDALFCPEVDPGPGYRLLADDCDDASSAVHPDAEEWCNGTDDDCDAVADEGSAIDAFTAYADQDGDGWGGQAQTTCGLAAGLVIRGGDCSDVLPDAYPGAPEVCGDAIRQDCADLDPDDCDGDGFLAHDPDPAAADCADDPVAGGADVSPGAPEVCDGLDNDCDGLTDSDDADVEPPGGIVWYRDADGDGYGSPVVLAADTCEPPLSSARNADDCDDLRAGTFPGAAELCDSADNDCDGSADEDAASAPLFFYDGDGDGSGDPAYTAQSCLAPAGSWALAGNDCDDADPDRGPLLPELCDDGRDNDCDGLVDASDPDANLLASRVWYLDADGDGVGGAVGVPSCADPSAGAVEYVITTGDCDDGDPTEKGPTVWFLDGDQDGHAGTLAVVFDCSPGDGWFAVADDCADGNDTIHPGVPETCDGVDQDCDGVADDAAFGMVTFHQDLDGDGWGAGVARLACSAPGPLWSLVGGDCDDADALRSPGVYEVCGDFVDNDCDLAVDVLDAGQGSPDAPAWYADADNDGVGWGAAVHACAAPPGHVSATGDCDPADGDVLGPDVWFEDRDDDLHAGTLAAAFGCWPGPGWYDTADDCVDTNEDIAPGRPEICNFTDDDCDAVVDNADPLDASNPPLYADEDGDGWGDDAVIAAYGCFAGPDQSERGGDCDDGDFDAHPMAPEIGGNLADDDCDGTVDEGGGESPPPPEPPLYTCVGWQWPDDDGDLWGDRLAPPTWSCGELPDHSATPGDCNDADALNVPTVHSPSNGPELTVSFGIGCRVILLDPGFAETGTWAPSGGSTVTLASADPSQPAVLAPAAGSSVIQATAGGASLIVKDVELAGSSTMPLLQVAGVGASLTVVQSLVDPAATGSGIKATAGVLALLDVTVANANAAIQGSALRVEAGATARVDGLYVYHSTSALGAVSFDAAADLTLDDLHLEGSTSVRVSGGNSGDTVRITDLAVIGALGDGVYASTDATLELERVVVAGSSGAGVRYAPSMGGTLDVSHATVVANTGTGIAHTGMGFVSIRDSLVLDNGPYDVSEVYMGGELKRSYVGDSSGVFNSTNPIGVPPMFVTYHPALDPALLDLHLRAGSSGKGAALGGDDAGAYLASDPYYLDSEPDDLPDGWELRWYGHLASDRSLDLDQDGLDAELEYARGTSPIYEDTDGDSVIDLVDFSPLDPGAQ